MDGSGRKNSDFTIDGVPNSMNKGIVFVPPQTAVSEFKVQSLSFDASVGRTAGALVNVSLKSGTNDLHGEAHWFLQDHPLRVERRRSIEHPQGHRAYRGGAAWRSFRVARAGIHLPGL